MCFVFCGVFQSLCVVFVSCLCRKSFCLRGRCRDATLDAFITPKHTQSDLGISLGESVLRSSGWRLWWTNPNCHFECCAENTAQRGPTHPCFTPNSSQNLKNTGRVEICISLFSKVCPFRTDEFSTCSEDRPLFAQFCANDPEILLTAARHVQHQVDAIDLNLGCPQRIARRGRYVEQTIPWWLGILVVGMAPF